MPKGSKRTKSSHRKGDVSTFGSVSKRDSQPLLVIATDVCLWATMIAVAIGFGGRMASGQLALVVGASLTAFCWMLHLFTSSESRYAWTGSEWLWCAGILIALAQIVPLPTEFLFKISPHIKEILPLWFDKGFANSFLAKWNQLSLAPWDTASGLATFVAYAMLFLVAAQRVHTIKDVERMLCRVSLAVVAMMLFAQLQYLTGNGKFFWTYDHPHIKTDSYPLGCFTNRNHLAQFLALGIAPTIWWLLRRLQQQELDRAQFAGIPAGLHSTAVALLLSSLGGIVLTILMTLSRGGLIALVLSSCVAVGFMFRIGLASLRFSAAMVLVGMVTAGLFSASKYESSLANRLGQTTGRNEIWLANIQVARDFLILGTGIGTHADAYQLRIDSKREDGREYSHAENGYLQVASESGLAGIVVAGLLIVTSFWWCLGAVRNPDSKVSSAAATILASLVANVTHAIGDFFWYTPVCMMLLAMQLACAFRCYRLSRHDAGRFVFSFRLPRIVTAAAMCGLIPTSLWMLELKWPAALAEPHHVESLLLEKPDGQDLTEQELTAVIEHRIEETVLAAKLDPRDSRLQEAAADAYLQLFDLKQKAAENTMTASMIRDAVRASEFETVEAANEWLQRAVGANLKYLRLAIRSLKRSLANNPLRAKSYVLLTDVCFLDNPNDAKMQEEYLIQALKLRPNDAETMYLAGRAGLQGGDMEKALSYWRLAFERSPAVRERIANVLATEVSFDFFQQEFHPGWRSLEVIAKAFVRSDRQFEARQAQRLYVHKAITYAKKIESDEKLELMLISVRNTCRALGDIPAAASVLTYAAKRLPQSYSIRYMLCLDLVESNQSADATEHLKWCTGRHPDDMNLRKLAAMALAQRVKQTAPIVRQAQDDEKTSSKH